MKVKWTEFISASAIENIWSLYPEADSNDFDKNHEGEVIGTTETFFGGTKLVVVCTDGNVRSVDITKVTVIKEVV